MVQELIDEQTAKGISHDRIILAGFSQGGVIALQLGLRLDKRIAGIVALSTYLHDAIKTEEQRHDANLALPILMVHGTQDPMIPIMRAATSRENLIRLGYDVQWKDYPMGHQVCLEELSDISAFLRSCL
jgi:phospholipase/carboxylesterase